METREEEVHLDKTEARAGSTPGVARYVLIISLVLVVAALSLIWIVGAKQAPENTGGTADTRQAVEQGEATAQDLPGQAEAPPTSHP